MEDEEDTVDPRVAELETADEAYEYSVEYSRSHITLYNQGMIKLTAQSNLEFCEDLKVVAHNRKFFGHHDGPGKGGTKKKMLLPSGIVMSYQEWGAEAAPPIVLLHDICDCTHAFDKIKRPLADKYRVLVPDIRGHGETTHSPRHQYGIEQLVEDLHEMVVRLSLNGRDWGGAWTRPWVLGGRGMGAAIAAAYAAKHKGVWRVSRYGTSTGVAEGPPQLLSLPGGALWEPARHGLLPQRQARTAGGRQVHLDPLRQPLPRPRHYRGRQGL